MTINKQQQTINDPKAQIEIIIKENNKIVQEKEDVIYNLTNKLVIPNIIDMRKRAKQLTT